MSKQIKDIVIAGSGNVAEAIAIAVSECPTLTLRQVVGRNARRAGEIADKAGCDYCTDPGNAAPADLAAHDPGLLRSVVTFELWLCLLAAMLMLVDIAVRRLTLADIRRMFSRQPSEK